MYYTAGKLPNKILFKPILIYVRFASSYKIVCLVSIGEKKEQGVRVGSRCVWNTDWDTYATASYENHHIYAVGICYALYYE